MLAGAASPAKRPHTVGKAFLQLLILLAQRSELLGLVHLHAAVLRLPGIAGVLRNPDFPSHLRRGSSSTSLKLLQNPLGVQVSFDIRCPLSFVRNIIRFGRVLGFDQSP
jgi:hypothetical protein